MSAAAYDYEMNGRRGVARVYFSTCFGPSAGYMPPKGRYVEPCVPRLEAMPFHVDLHAEAGGSYFGGMTTGLESRFDDPQEETVTPVVRHDAPADVSRNYFQAAMPDCFSHD